MFARPIVILRRQAKNPPDCHSEPLGEESHLVYFYFALLAILRLAQDDNSPPQTPIWGNRCISLECLHGIVKIECLKFALGFAEQIGFGDIGKLV